MNKGLHRFTFTVLYFVSFFSSSLFAQQIEDNSSTIKPSHSNDWVYKMVHLEKQKKASPHLVKVAVVDDGFLLSHNSIKQFIYSNKKEIPDNFQDDDHNGYLDDLSGWDISDNDNNVSIPKGLESTFYHGTYISSLIISVFKRYFGESAHDKIRIIPVKVLSDRAKNTYLADGYKGIKYAIEAGADIICCAWSGGEIPEEIKSAILEAKKKGVVFIGAAGNFSNEKALAPSSAQGFISVAAIDSLFQKTKESNYGMRIDLSSPGDYIYAAYPVANNAFTEISGTSPATAIISGCVAILKSLKPSCSSQDIVEALQNTASPIDSLNKKYTGKLGSGIPNIENAVNYLSEKSVKYLPVHYYHTKATIKYHKKISPTSFYIKPTGAFKGIHIYAQGKSHKGKIIISNNDSICFLGPISTLSNGLFLKGNHFTLELQKNSTLSKEIDLNYFLETIDSTKLYCNETQYIAVNQEGELTDNSEEENYSNNSSCKWQLTAPPGKKIEVEFLNLDTEPNIDYVYIFDGESTLQENILAKFSGNNKPPTISSVSNQLLIWFITNDKETKKGWRLRYKMISQ